MKHTIIAIALLLTGCCTNDRMRVADDVERIKDITRLIKEFESRGEIRMAYEMMKNKCYVMQRALEELNAPIADYCGCRQKYVTKEQQ